MNKVVLRHRVFVDLFISSKSLFHPSQVKSDDWGYGLLLRMTLNLRSIVILQDTNSSHEYNYNSVRCNFDQL